MKATTNRMLRAMMSVVLTLCLLLQSYVPLTAIALEATVTDGVIPEAGETGGSVSAGLRDYSIPSNSKHAYDPFAQLESEEATQAYRDSVQYVAGTIIYKVTETKGLFSSTYNSKAAESDLAEAGIAVDSAKVLYRKEVKDGVFSDTYEVTYQAELTGDVWEAVDTLAETAGVVDAQPNYLYEDTAIDVPTISKNPDKDKQWQHGPDHLDCDKHWQHMHDEDITPGEGAIVAVIDTGVDYTHPDLAANMWVNTAEFNGTPGVDDDGNGYVDDIHGCSTLGASYYHSGDPMDDHGHGTHVAGIIAMTANNDEGAVGLAYGAQIMAIKAGQATGVFTDTDIAEAIRYAKAMGADVINMSFGGAGKSFLVEEALSDAFSSCVLVAAAGNSAMTTLDAPDVFPRADFYPAGHSFVLGVMASDQKGYLAGFSNWDFYNNGGSAEYELTAPGVNIYSTLPGGQYASWSGTSMAAPLVSAAAAMVRSKFSDKSLYSSRFIMGQLASATDKELFYIDGMGWGHVYPCLDIDASLNQLPEPNLYAKNIYLFDDPAIDPANDGDGIIDAGETIDVGLVIRNQWGLAENVEVTFSSISGGGVHNPNIEWITNTIQMDEVGTFNEQNNGFVYDEQEIVGTANPIRFKVKADTINDASIGFDITITCQNGLDEEDTATYTYDPDGFELTFYVQRGRTISGKITEDLTMTSEDYWIIENSLYIPEGVTVTVEPGTQIQFGGSNISDTIQPIVYIQVDGTFLVQGTEEQPVEMFPSAAYHDCGVEIFDGMRDYQTQKFKNDMGNIYFEYAYILNPLLELDRGDHLHIVQNTDMISRLELSNNKIIDQPQGGRVHVRDLQNSRIRGLGSKYIGGWPASSIAGEFRSVLLNECECLVTQNYMLDLTLDSAFLNVRYSTVSQVGEAFIKEQVTFADVFTYGDKKYVLATWDEIGISSLNRQRYDYYTRWAALKGGTLACLNSPEETGALVEYVGASKPNEWIYLGFMADKTTGELSWADGDNTYFPPEATPSPQFSSYPYGYMVVNSEGIMSMSTTGSESCSNALLEFPATMSDEEITTPLTAAEYFAGTETGVKNSAILNALLATPAESWFRIETDTDKTHTYSGMGNYWGTTNEKLIQAQLLDEGTYVHYSDLLTDPYLTLDSPELETIYPFVTEAYITDTEGNRITSCGYQEIQLHVTFNRDMDTSILPMVSYGPAKPYTDYVVNGAFVDPRHWVGTTTVTPIIDAGTEYIRIKDAAAAEDAWLLTGTDTGRFAFTIANTGAEALVMQAEGKENKVELSWMQDDYDTLAGFNVYRSTEADGTFEKLNTRLIPGTVREYVDTDVQPGVEYFYYFTVMGTDLVESNPSNIAAATPLDNVKPLLTHNRVYNANYGEAISFNVTATDNIGVDYVRLYYRAKGETQYKQLDMSSAEGNSYFGTIAAKDVAMAGMEYYVEISDGVSVVREGSAQYPIEIAVDNTMVIYSVSPFKVDVNSDETVTATLTGVNFSESMTLKVGGKPVDYTFVSPKQISFTIPAGAIGRVDITLTDGERKAALPNAITYTDSGSEVQIIAPGEAKAWEQIRLPITVTAKGDLYGVDMQLKLDRSLYSEVTFEKAAACAGAISSCAVDDNGIVKISMASSDALATDGPIGYLVLTPANLTSAANDTIQITSALFNAVAVNTTVDCNLVIRAKFSISGRITYYNSDEGVEGVKVTLSNGMVTYTDENGNYTFTGITTNQIVVTPQFSGYVNNAVSAQDASLVLQAITEEGGALSDLQFLAADVDGDGVLTSLDAAYILQKSVGKIEGDFPGSGAEWAFSDSRRVLNLSDDLTNVDFTGVLLGDVTGDWTSTPAEELE